MTTTIDFWRQLDLFSPEKFGHKPVQVIGAGAVGSYVAYLLAKMGVENIHIYDDDIVEAHNLPNQIFRLQDVGRPKVEGAVEIIQEATGIKVIPHFEKVTGETKLDGIVFLLVDSMDVRQEIWAGAIKFKLNIDLMVETRMAIDHGRVYAIRPANLMEVKFWESTLYPDEEAEESPCSNRSIGPTVAYIASLSVWKLIKFFNGLDFENELIVSARPSAIIANSARI